MVRRMGAVPLLAFAFLVIGVLMVKNLAMAQAPVLIRRAKMPPPPLPSVDPFLSAARSEGFKSEFYPLPKPPRCIKLGRGQKRPWCIAWNQCVFRHPNKR